uniref:Replication protein A C-terminal domain-containing protein n=1 Tax=Ditylenchus dipsaci TaxID=166011 RepID=A0A915DII7_9BILA
MDSSFDAFGGGGGWGEQGEKEFTTNQNSARSNMYEKIPMPASIESLLQIKGDEEKYKIDVYSFHTIKTMGKVAAVRNDGGTTKYDLVDPEADDPSLHESFAVISYSGSDGTGKQEDFEQGDILQAVGKLRFYNQMSNLVSFHNRKVESKEEVELFQLEAKVARHYYALNIPERSVQQLENMGIGLFSGLAPIRPEKAGQTPSMNTPARSRIGGQMQTPNTGGKFENQQGARKLYQSPVVGNKSDLAGQRSRIMEYIKMNGHKSGGVSADEIKRACKVNDKFQDDINFLLGEGVVYNTMDDDHFAIIQ